MNIMVVDPNQDRLALIRQVAEEEEGWRVVAQGEDPVSAVRQLDGIAPIDTLVINIDAPYAAEVRMWGILRATVNVQRILGLTARKTASAVDFALAMDFSGIQPIPVEARMLKETMRKLARNEPAYDPELMEGYRLELVSNIPDNNVPFPASAMETASKTAFKFHGWNWGEVA